MKSLFFKIVLLLVAILGCHLSAIFAEPIKMLNANVSWRFGFTTQETSWTYSSCFEFWSVVGDTIISEKLYYNLYRDYGYLDSSNTIGMWPYSDEPYAVGKVIAVREDKGKVFARKDQYLSYIHQLYPELLEPYIAETDDPDEVLLYDYTLQVGDIYPCRDQAQIISEKRLQTHDGVERRVLFLSNSQIIIEGIGCVNSLGTLIIYQNHSVSANYEESRHSMLIYAELAEFGLCEDPYIFISDIYQNNMLTALLVEKIVESPPYQSPFSTFFDLSGRRIVPQSSIFNHQFPRGIYIRDGKKVVVR